MMTHRRTFLITAVGTLATGRPGMAQQPGRSYRLGWLASGALRTEPYNMAFVQRLAELGFAEGRNLVIEHRTAQGRHERLPELAAELARLNCDVIFAPGTEAALRAVVQASRDTPIVIVTADYDPVTTGHVSSLARPGGRITGVSMLQTELPAKRLQVLKEMLPKVRRVGVLADVANAGQLQVTRDAAVKLALELVVHEFKTAPYDFSAAFATFARGKAEAMVSLGSSFFVPGRRLIPELALKHKLPSVFTNNLWADSGGLMSYGPDFSAAFRRAAEQVVQLLGGARPGDMPIEQPNIIEMVINLKTAKAQGVVVPQALRLRADRIIE
jgi:putative ABC transport system substrate-binding protein